MQPLAFAVLAGVTPPWVELEFWDERLEPIPATLDCQVVALTIETYTAYRAYQLARRFRDQGIKVVAGGYHPTFLPEEAGQFVDTVVCGDAESLWPEILRDARRGELKPRYQAPPNLSMARLRYDRSIFRGKRYGLVRPLQFSRGCRFACDFCSIHAFYGRSLTCRPVEEVLAEVDSLDSRWVFMVDDNLFVSRTETLKLLDALRGTRMRWGCQISIDVAADQQLLQALAEAGCVAVLIGFESLDPQNLGLMKKKWNDRHPFKEAIVRFHDHGLMVYGSFIFGYDHDGPDVFARTLDFALSSKLFLVNFSALTPTPATGLYRRMEREKLLLFPRWWLDPGYSYGEAVYQPARMTPSRLTEGCLWAREQFFACGHIARRVLAPAPGCASIKHRFVALVGNLISRHALGQKLSRSLGGDEPAPRLLELGVHR
jgi:radical SAM superfamily enzyme YgiQ (UPF0313 family)